MMFAATDSRRKSLFQNGKNRYGKKNFTTLWVAMKFYDASKGKLMFNYMGKKACSCLKSGFMKKAPSKFMTPEKLNCPSIRKERTYIEAYEKKQRHVLMEKGHRFVRKWNWDKRNETKI
ncbi:hypothetical protein AVEN_87457-1 [Araneus ventricosus]|uniref:Uncharacterized protein n=1 Tax=Araneus ventricosus TaxID=182803 RepID=A0A4Y1ZY65_ARAVE|nr:hypothetical protein AVEN_87457-1 [Araneus ventricosus]